MKKMISLLLAAIMVLSLAACGGSNEPSDTKESDISEQVTQSEEPAEETTTEETAPAASYEITGSTVKAWTNSIGSQWVQTIVEITNTGSANLYLSSGAYDLENADGKLIASQTLVSEYPNVLAPGEKGYMYDETMLDQAVEGELKVLPRVEVEEATVDLIRYEVTETEVSNEEFGGIKILGRVENTSDEPGNLVYIVGFLYDADGNCIGRVFTILMEELEPGDKIGFEMSGASLPDDVTADAVADVVYYAYPEQMQFSFN